VTAAIDTIAEAGYAGASFARIAERLGISRGLILAGSTGPGCCGPPSDRTSFALATSIEGVP
jgi:hypothetical protein